MRYAFTHVTPVFRVWPDITNAPCRGPRTSDPYPTWSGSSLRAKGPRYIDSEWVVPSIPDNVINVSWNQHYVAWAGIDGDTTSSDVVQSGVHCWVQLVDPINGIALLRIYPWWEWFPEGEVEIANLPVGVGDRVKVSVGVHESDSCIGVLPEQVFWQVH